MAAEEEFPALAGGQGVQGRFHKGREFQRTGAGRIRRGDWDMPSTFSSEGQKETVHMV